MLNITCNNISRRLTAPGRGRRDGSDHCHVPLYSPLHFRLGGAADTLSVSAAAGVQSRCKVRKVPLLLGLTIQPFLTEAFALDPSCSTHSCLFFTFLWSWLVLRLFSTLPPRNGHRQETVRLRALKTNHSPLRSALVVRKEFIRSCYLFTDASNGYQAMFL